MEAWEERFAQSMRMPPFMNSSNAGPLSLAHFQYRLLMAWVESVQTAAPQLGAPPPGSGSQASPALLGADAAARRARVLGRLANEEEL
jgi:hypothetical protein